MSAAGDAEENAAVAAGEEEEEEDRGVGGRDEDRDNNREGMGGRERTGAEVSGTAASVEKGERTRQEEEATSPPPPPPIDWMGRVYPVDPEVLSPFAAARQERILMLPGWVRALKPWGDLLQV